MQAHRGSEAFEQHTPGYEIVPPGEERLKVGVGWNVIFDRGGINGCFGIRGKSRIPRANEWIK